MVKERPVISNVSYIIDSQTLLFPFLKIPKCRLQPYQFSQNIWGGKQASVIFQGHQVIPICSKIQEPLDSVIELTFTGLGHKHSIDRLIDYNKIV